MDNFLKDNCIKIGTLRKPHGVYGTLVLNFDRKWEILLEQAEILLVEFDGLLVPWFVTSEGIRIISGISALVDLDGITDQQSAKRMCSRDVYIENAAANLSSSNNSPDEWIGYSLFGESGNYIGKITGEDNYSGSIVLTVEAGKETMLIPFHPDLVIVVDDERQQMTLRLPDGMLDI